MTDLLVDPTVLAQRLGVETPTPLVLSMVEDAILDSTAKVLTFLNRDTLTGRAETLTGLSPDTDFALSDAKAWPQAADYFDDIVAVVGDPRTNAANPYAFDVDFIVGMDLRNDPRHPIVRFIATDARTALRTDADFCGIAGIERVITSVSAGGQSVSYDKGSANSQDAGGTAGLAGLRRYKRFAIGRSNSRPFAPWPYNTSRTY